MNTFHEIAAKLDKLRQIELLLESERLGIPEWEDDDDSTEFTDGWKSGIEYMIKKVQELIDG